MHHYYRCANMLFSQSEKLFRRLYFKKTALSSEKIMGLGQNKTINGQLSPS